MGQRTQIIYQKVANSGQKTTKIYHLQWGYGRQMPLHFMRLVIDDHLKKATFAKDYNFLSEDVIPMHFTEHDDISQWIEGRPAYIEKQLQEEGLTDERREELLDWLAKAKNFVESLKVFDITDAKQVARLLDRCDNNNGAMLIQAHEGKYEYNSTKFTIGFMFGYEDFDNAYDKIVSAEEYLSKHGGSEYSDEEFRKMFKDFCDYFGVKEMV